MVNLTISLSDETLRKLRKTVREKYGDRKGALSGLIESSIREKLDAFQVSQPAQKFKAVKGESVIAEATDLRSLARKLETLNVDPRSVRIISSRKIAPVIRTGLRGREP